MIDQVRCRIERAPGFDGLTIDFYRRVGYEYEVSVGRGTGIDAGRITYAPARPEGTPDRDGYLLLLTRDEEMAFRAAIEERHDPPTESKALREALELERRRVDLILGKALS